jgi:phosphopantothenoylcysteine decarboxylase/phosphopantothenate--cysteine ligase
MTFSAFQGRCLHLGVSGSVAAYKAVELMRLWQRGGIEVSVTLTEAAARFISPLTFASLGAQCVSTHIFDERESGPPFAHLAPGEVCDAFVIAPATATTLARLAYGMADEILSAQALAFPDPLVLAPAMNPRMWNNSVTQANARLLASRGHILVGPDHGVAACGETGTGKLADVEEIYYAGLRALCRKACGSDLSGRSVLVTLGSTREAWDGVRYWTNPSTGHMGACLACAAWLRGAETHVVAGPGAVRLPSAIRRTDVTSAREMYAAARDIWPSMDAGIFTAAVADFSPMPLGAHKFKKTGAEQGFSIAFTPNPDILRELASTKKPGQRVLGFAAETNDLEQNTRAKVRSKGADIIVGNRVGLPGSGFASPTNEVFVVDASEREEAWPELPKPDVAWRLLNWLFSL